MKPLRTVALLVPVAFGLLVHWMIGHPLEWLAIMGGFFACFLCGMLYQMERDE